MDKQTLQTARYPKIFSELATANYYLKAVSLAELGCAILSLLVVVALVNRRPVVLPLGAKAETLKETVLPSAEDQIEAAINRYLELRYKWEPATVKARLAEAKAFVVSKAGLPYELAVANVIRFATEKNVSQRVYPDKIAINLEKGIVVISGDRVTEIQGLKAAGNLRLELGFTNGPRTKENPWGVYVTREKEEL